MFIRQAGDVDRQLVLSVRGAWQGIVRQIVPETRAAGA
jgi:hypothetical protein